MLSISPPMKGVAHAKYYLEISRQDYYTAAGNEPGMWFGAGAAKLGLDGRVDPRQYENVLYGLAPDGSWPLVQNAGNPRRQTGWDLTFSAPKSVGVLWAVAPDAMRQEIEAAHRYAVETSLSYLEDVAGITRRGKGGTHKERASLAFATFFHGTSRALDPQPHTHSILLNVAVREDGTTGTLQSRDIFRTKMTAGALYQVSLAQGLKERLGLELTEDVIGFRVKGVSKELCRAFSTRRKEIDRVLAELGFSDPKTSREVAERTRPKKVQVDRESLRLAWKGKAERLGFREDHAAALAQGRIVHHCRKDELFHAFEEARAKLSPAQRSHGTLRGLAAKVSIAQNADSKAARALLEHLRQAQWGAYPWQRASQDLGNRRQADGHAKAKAHGNETNHARARTSEHGLESAAVPEKTEERQGKGAKEETGKKQSPNKERGHGMDAAARPGTEDGRGASREETRRPSQEAKSETTVAGAHRLWTASKITELDPRRCRTEQGMKALYGKYRSFIQTGEIVNPLVSSPMDRSRAQAKRNKAFATALDNKASAVGVKSHTLLFLTWKAVDLAVKKDADSWALFSAVRNLAFAAERDFQRQTGCKLFSKELLSEHPHVLKGRWGKVLWEKELFFADVRIQKKRVFEKAEILSGARAFELPAFRIVPKKPNWSKLVKRVLDRPAKPHDSSRQSQHDTHSSTRTESHSEQSH